MAGFLCRPIRCRCQAFGQCPNADIRATCGWSGLGTLREALRPGLGRWFHDRVTWGGATRLRSAPGYVALALQAISESVRLLFPLARFLNRSSGGAREEAVAKETIGKGRTELRDNAGAGLVNSERRRWDAAPRGSLGLTSGCAGAAYGFFHLHFPCRCG